MKLPTKLVYLVVYQMQQPCLIVECGGGLVFTTQSSGNLFGLRNEQRCLVPCEDPSLKERKSFCMLVMQNMTLRYLQSRQGLFDVPSGLPC